MSLPLALGPVRPVPLSAGSTRSPSSPRSLVVTARSCSTSCDLVTPAVVLAAELCLLPAAGLTAPRDLLAPHLAAAARRGRGRRWVNVLLSATTRSGWLAGVGARRSGCSALALPGVLLVASTDPVRLADALTLHWRVSTRFAYGALAALRLVPLLVAECRRSGWPGGPAASRPAATRWPRCGCSPGRRSRCWSGAVRRGSRLATAMDARGFDSGIPRTNARGSRLHARDAAFVVGAVVVCAAAVDAQRADRRLGPGLRLTGRRRYACRGDHRPTRYVALLRGINLGKARQVGMPRLRGGPRPRAATGTSAPTCAAATSSSTARSARPSSRPTWRAAIEEEFGFAVPVVVRTGAEIAAVVAGDPFATVATDPARYLVTFLPEAPAEGQVDALPPAEGGGRLPGPRPGALPLAARRHPEHAARRVEVGPAARRRPAPAGTGTPSRSWPSCAR